MYRDVLDSKIVQGHPRDRPERRMEWGGLQPACYRIFTVSRFTGHCKGIRRRLVRSVDRVNVEPGLEI
jgi:hypothetical protein